MDFGIAKIVDSEKSLTKTGTQIGTVFYMSPEQVKGGKVDHCSDIYSLGVTLFQMVTGQCPYNNDTTEFQIYNTSSFNYRKVKNSNKLSTHALGLAIDINPRDNPFIDRHGNKSPPNGVYDSSRPGTITSSSQCYKIFEKYGWKWGGHWRYSKDYQHFSKYGK